MHLVFFEVLPPLPLDFGPARGAGVPLGICLSRAGSLLLLLLRGGSASGHLSVACGLAPSSPPPSGGGGAGVGSLAADALFPLLLVC